MRRTLALAGGVMLALAFSQFPEYAQQYEQRLGGAVDELRIITEKFDADATAAGLTREQAFARYAQTSDDFIAGQGRNAEETFLRYARLSADLTEISTASPMDRLRLLPKFLDAEVGRRSLPKIEPGVLLTPEGLGWAEQARRRATAGVGADRADPAAVPAAIASRPSGAGHLGYKAFFMSHCRNGCPPL